MTETTSKKRRDPLGTDPQPRGLHNEACSGQLQAKKGGRITANDTIAMLVRQYVSNSEN
jgi:hypothetical protein